MSTVIIGKDSKLDTIGDAAFTMCSALAYIVIPLSVSSISKVAFNTLSTNFSAIYYCGTADEWDANFADYDFYSWTNIYYFSVNKPENSGNYWYYDDNGEVQTWTY